MSESTPKNESPKNERVLPTSVRLSVEELAAVDTLATQRSERTRARVTRQAILRAMVQDGLRAARRER